MERDCSLLQKRSLAPSLSKNVHLIFFISKKTFFFRDEKNHYLISFSVPKTRVFGINQYLYGLKKREISELFFLQNKKKVHLVPKTLFLETVHNLIKEVIQPHLPVRLPCYDFTPVTSPALGIPLQKGWGNDFGHSQLPWCDGRCVQGPGTYSPQYG